MLKDNANLQFIYMGSTRVEDLMSILNKENLKVLEISSLPLNKECKKAVEIKKKSPTNKTIIFEKVNNIQNLYF